jgi:hypothetical protein
MLPWWQLNICRCVHRHGTSCGAADAQMLCYLDIKQNEGHTGAGPSVL